MGGERGGGTNVSCQLKFRPFVSCRQIKINNSPNLIDKLTDVVSD